MVAGPPCGVYIYTGYLSADPKLDLERELKAAVCGVWCGVLLSVFWVDFRKRTARKPENPPPAAEMHTHRPQHQQVEPGVAV